MKTRAQYIFIVANLLMVAILQAQLTITIENVQNQQLPAADILSVDFMTEKITKWGSIDEKGDASFSLDYDFMDKILKEAEQQQKDAPKGWKMSFHTVGSKHECNKYSNLNTVEIENPDARVFGLPPFFVGEETSKTNPGSMYMASNRDVAVWLDSYQMENAATGFYIEWMYVEKESSVNGTCSTLTMTGHEDEEIDVSTVYDLNFEEGWNMVIYTIDEIFKSASGRVFLKKMTVSASTLLPDGAQVYLLNDN